MTLAICNLNCFTTSNKYIVVVLPLLCLLFSVYLYIFSGKYFCVLLSEKLKTQLRKLYSDLTMPFQQRVFEDSSTKASLDDMFVDLRIQRHSVTRLPESPNYRDVEELERLMQSSDPIELSELFDKLHDRLAPRSVLILGRAGVGKSTLMKQMAQLWARRELWKDTVEYLFLLTLRELQQGRKWTLADLLLDGLPLTGAEKSLAIRLLLDQSANILLVIEGLDEIPFHDNGFRERNYKQKTDLNTILASIADDAMMKGAKVIVTSRPNDNIPQCERKTELYGFPKASISKYIHKFSRNDTRLENYITGYLQNNVNITTLCYLPVQCNFVCAYLSDMHSAITDEDQDSLDSMDASTACTMTRLYVLAIINMSRKHGMKHISRTQHKTPVDDKLGVSVKRHAGLAKSCTMSTPLQIIMYENDLQLFDIGEEDKQRGFLAESVTKNRAACFIRPCWSFHHLTVQEMFAAVALLLGPREELMKLVEDPSTITRREVLIKFVIGLWCDAPNKDFMDLVSGQVEPREAPRSGKPTCKVSLETCSCETRVASFKISCMGTGIT